MFFPGRIADRAASQTIGDYAIELTLQATGSEPAADLSPANGTSQKEPGTRSIQGKLRILSYLQPQDPLFFERPDKPVAGFDYDVRMTQARYFEKTS